MASDRRLPIIISAAGGLAIALGLAWWWLVFSEVIAGDYVTYRQAASCILGTNDLCSLAQALCKSNHFLGIKRYSSELLWVGVAVSSAGLFLASRQRTA
ncbi:hypothetical protein [Rhizobium tubonense]|uniref:Uncharacterized protein n=1 Tax=Rhizobium tubonense TaxID=484088 RepID=A0A2W4CSV2_9HYPH|nr:hypothetical protein [Rhizobium tubonense]PZM15499.1 hypothetical protein CPY51_06620 [Rhizobium tubonense]